MAVSEQMTATGGDAASLAAQIAEVAQTAFMDASQHAMLISAIIAGVTAALMLLTLPKGDKALSAEPGLTLEETEAAHVEADATR
ncbi:hypothetical protein [Demequina litorisediminis]|nr:hypothetical protein [Demequina litorisediminis]